jgi:hypothetical protein
LSDLFGEGRNRKKWQQPYDRHSRRYYDHHDEKKYYDNDYPFLNQRRYEPNGDYHLGHDKIHHILSMLKSYPHKKSLIMGALILGFIILLVCLALIWAMFPVIMKAVYSVEQNGIKGISEFITQILTKLWEGNG